MCSLSAPAPGVMDEQGGDATFWARKHARAAARSFLDQKKHDTGNRSRREKKNPSSFPVGAGEGRKAQGDNSA